MARKVFKKKRDKNKIVARKKACRFCIDKELPIDYKLSKQLTGFLTERGKIVPRRVTGNCAFHQRQIETQVRRARQLALLPYTITHALS